MDITEILLREFDKSQVIIDEKALVSYSTDESSEGPYLPQAALIAHSPLEVEILLKLALENGFPVTPRGLGTGKSGGALPYQGGVLLALDEMNRILDIDERSLFAIVEPGVITQDLHNAVLERNLFYPPDPASLDTCSIGGNVAENAGGPRAFRYGVTREYTLGMEIVTMGGRRFNVGKKSVKGVSGYDLQGLLTGSEGTLAVFTKLIMKIIPKPLQPGIIVAYYDDFISAGKGINILLSTNLFPMSMELMDKTAMDHVRGIGGFSPPKEAGGAIIIEIEGLPLNNSILTNVKNILSKGNPLHIDVALDEISCENIWSARRVVSTKLKEQHKHKISEDIAIPRGAIPEMISKISSISESNGLQKGCYGHAGDGNLHVNFISDDDNPFDQFQNAVRELFILTTALGGTLSGEHGIGLSKKRYMPIEHSPFSMEIMKNIKNAWDPWSLLNPGKIFN